MSGITTISEEVLRIITLGLSVNSTSNEIVDAKGRKVYNSPKEQLQLDR